jgi:hypothetical protein
LGTCVDRIFNHKAKYARTEFLLICIHIHNSTIAIRRLTSSITAGNLSLKENHTDDSIQKS